MATYSPLHKTFWSDKDLRKLDIFGRHLFLYFFSGPDVTPSGMYSLSIEKMAFESMIPEDKIREILASGKMKNISYDEKTEYIFVHKKLKFSPGGRKEFINNGIKTQYKLTPENPLWKKFDELYPGILKDLPNCSPTVKQQLDNSSAIVSQQKANRSSTVQQLFNTNTNTNTNTVVSVVIKDPNPSLSSGQERGIKNSVTILSKDRGTWFNKFFKAYPGKKPNPAFCKTQFMGQIRTAEDYAEFERVLEKYVSAHKTRKVADMARIRWMKAHEYFDDGWLKVADPNWSLGKKQMIKIYKSPEAIQEDREYWLAQVIKDLEAKDRKRLEEALESILEIEEEQPGSPKILTHELKDRIDNFLNQKEA